MNFIITRSSEDVDVYLMQKPTLGEVLTILQEDWRFSSTKALIWEITPSSDQANAPQGGMRLRQVATVGVTTTAQAKLNEALYYANQMGEEKEVDLITRFASQLLARLQELKDGKPKSISQSVALMQGEPKEEKDAKT